MIVTVAVSGPSDQSDSEGAGKSDGWVGPGVGFTLCTVQPGITFDVGSGVKEIGATVLAAARVSGPTMGREVLGTGAPPGT